MMKLVHSLGLTVALAATSLLAGCDLYFGGHGDHGPNDTWNYCGSDGYYQCQGDSCTWVGATCPQGGSGSGSGYQCTSSTDCAAGCYCASGTCEEGGFCSQDSDCGSGYHCNTARSSCEPNPQPTGCDYDVQCATGSYCAPDHTCQPTCSCTNDAQAVSQGFGWCDETRGTCLPGQDPAGTCAGVAASTCTTNQPVCPTGQVPTLIDGCYTGQCRDYGTCDISPVCSHINDETDCLDRATDCAPVYTGIGCQKPDGTACRAGDTNCTCQSFQFNSCTSRTP